MKISFILAIAVLLAAESTHAIPSGSQRTQYIRKLMQTHILDRDLVLTNLERAIYLSIGIQENAKNAQYRSSAMPAILAALDELDVQSAAFQNTEETQAFNSTREAVKNGDYTQVRSSARDLQIQLTRAKRELTKN